jgi:SAM-dependent methyltransferase
MPLKSLRRAPEASALELSLVVPKLSRARSFPRMAENLAAFKEFGEATRVTRTKSARSDGTTSQVLTFVNEFWTARQRQASSLHEVSYRACFKPQLPRFFIERLSAPGDWIYDPFMGRGTTPVEAALLGRVAIGNDANPLSIRMTRPRLNPPQLEQVEARLATIPLDDPADMPEDLLVFYHAETLRGISSLKKYLVRRDSAKALDAVDEWIALVALNRLTGHSSGFFSVYTLPPNQAVSARSQRKINEKRNQSPPERDVRKIILKKTRQLLGDVDHRVRAKLGSHSSEHLLLTGPASHTPKIPSDSVTLVVTSPPFLNVVQYATDNWLRCWFLGIDPETVQLTVPQKLIRWRAAMLEVFRELYRILKPGGHVAFEVGEVHSGETRLEETALPCGEEAGLVPELVVINDQEFTKTANCWGVDNMSKGTNTNRIVVFKKR